MAAQPVMWTPVQTEGPVDTLSEAVQQRLNFLNNDGTQLDLNQLSPQDLQSLIEYLDSVKNQPWAKGSGINNVLQALKQIQKTWSHNTGTGLDNLARDANCRLQVLQVLAPLTQTPQGVDLVDGLDTALQNMQSLVSSLEAAQQAVNKATQRWSANDTTSVENIRTNLNELIASQTALRAAGIDTAKLGLDKLVTTVQNALAAYDANPPAAGDVKATRLAVSKLRESVASAKLEYLTSNGATEKDARVRAEQSTLKVEGLWQQNLTIPWTEAIKFNGIPTTPKEISEEIEMLNQQYNMLAELGNKDGMKYVQARIAILERALNALNKGEDPLGVTLNLFLEVKLLEITTKKALRARVLEQIDSTPDEQGKKDLKKLADTYETEIETIQNLIKTAFDEYSGVLGKLVEVNSAALASAMGR